MDSSKKKKPSRVQGAWGGGGGGLNQSRKSGTIGQRRISEKHASANIVPHSSQNSDNRTIGSTSAGNCEKGQDGTANNSEGNSITISNTISNPSNRNFVFHQPTDRELFRKPPEIIAIQEEGVHEISTGPTGAARLRLFPQLFDKKDADWIFDDLMKQLPWRQQVNR